MSVRSRARSRAVVAALSFSIAAALMAGGAWADHRVVDRVSSGPLGGNGPAEPLLFELSADGARAFFLTADPLVPEDTDARRDAYVRAGGMATLLSTGPAGGNGPFDVTYLRTSDDGSTAVFFTAEQLVPGDTDSRTDLYQRVGGTTGLVSTGPAGGNEEFDIDLNNLAVSGDGSTVLFETSEGLTADDSNGRQDLYLRAGGQITRITGEPVNPSFDSHHVIGLSRDGARAFFSTTRELAGDDSGFPTHDTYRWEAGALTLQSVGANGEHGSVHTFSERIDADGRHLVFVALGRLVPEDTDAQADLYERVGNTIRLVAIGPAGGNGDHSASTLHITPDGSHVFFQTTERLVAADADSYQDIYVRADGATRLVSAGVLAVDQDFLIPQFDTATPDGSRAYFNTYERLTAEDTDGTASAYEYSGGDSATWLGPFGIAGVAADGNRLFVLTTEPLLPSDTDTECDDADIVGCEDVYEIRDGQTTLVSTGPGDPGSGDSGVCVNRSGVRIAVDCSVAVSDDGRRVLFWHNAPLLEGDTDSSFDIYLATAGPVRSDYRNANRFCRAERRFLGIEAFRDKYGNGRKQRHAFRNCVRANRR